MAIACTVAAPEASAAYEMRVLSDGQSSIVLAPGNSFTVDLIIQSDAGDACNSAIFRLLFSAEGLRYDAYAWGTPFVTGGPFDDSAPFGGSLPTTITSSSYSGVGYPSDDVDLFFSNAAFLPFGSGTIVSLTLTVPEDAPAESLMIEAVPDTLANGFTVVPTEAVGGLQVTVVPGPSVLAALAIGSVSLARRRRVDRGEASVWPAE